MKHSVVAVLLALGAAGASAQEFPNRPVRFLVAYPPGGGVDMMARAVAGVLGARLGQTVIVENRPGASGSLATGLVAKSTPDGYTILVTGDAPITQVPLLSKVSYDPYKDLTALVKGVTVPTSILVPASSPLRSLPDVLQFARANPGKLSYGTPGNGSGMHVELEMLKERQGIDITHVPYKGAPPIIVDTMASQISIGAPGIPAAIPNIRSGQLRLLGVWSAARIAAFPDVPTVREATGDASLEGLPTWYGFLLPAGVPPAIVARLEADIVASLKDPDVMKRMQDSGATVVAQTGAAFDDANQQQTATFATIFKKLNLKPD